MQNIIKKFMYVISCLFRRQFFGFVKGHDYLSKESLCIIQKLVGKSNHEIIQKFDIKFATYVGGGQAVSFAAGRMGFYALMQTLGIGEGDEVILQGHTCSVMPNAVWRTGATPVFADIDPNTFGSSATEIEKIITPNTKLIVAQHSFGIPCNIKPIIELAKAYEIFLLEDCAITFGSKINGVSVGNFGDAAIFSIDHSKPLNAFIGGVIYTSNNELYKKLKLIQISSEDLPAERQEAIWKKFLFERRYYSSRNYGKSFIISIINSVLLHEKESYLTDDDGKEPSSSYPYPAKLPAFLARLGLYELERWELEKNKRQNLLTAFLDLSNSVGLTEFLPPPYFNSNLEIVPLRFVYTHPSSDMLRKKMSKYIDINWFWFLEPIIACKNPQDLGYVYGSCPLSEKTGKEIINWPCVFSESDDEQLLKNFEMIST